MELYRPLRDEDGDEGSETGARDVVFDLETWLDFLMHERELAIQRVRYCDEQLVRHGRLRAYTLPKRIR